MSQCTGTTKTGNQCSRNARPGTETCRQHAEGLLESLGGRPSKLTEDLAERILDAAINGNYRETACAAVGISKRTLYNWIAKAEEFDEAATVPADRQLLVTFVHALKRAEAIAEMALLHQAKAGGMGWQAPMTVLERKYPGKWSRRREDDPDQDKPTDAPKRDLSRLSDDDLEQLRGLEAKAAVAT